ncbi:hypothetical protein F4680DRAFT_463432 [Xylaria scruposa]|nr:hypothetical protein F4680DRAFT_463432 [Xylaria scruposa]
MTDHDYTSVTTDDYLIVQACYIDRVVRMTPIINELNAAELCLHLYRTIPSRDNMPWHYLVERLWRTLVLNRVESQEVWCISATPPLEMAQSFLAFIIETQLQVMAKVDTADAPDSDSTLHYQLRSLKSSQPFRDLLRKNAYGRRFFMTVNDKFGMTAVENTDVLHPYYEDHVATSDHMDQNVKGFIIVACVGGRYPYMLFNTGRKQEVKPYLNCFEFYGECHLHDAMDGEDFRVRASDQNGLRVFPYNAGRPVEIAIE